MNEYCIKFILITNIMHNKQYVKLVKCIEIVNIFGYLSFSDR